MEVGRPRVAAIGLDRSQAEAIRPLCGTLRLAESLKGYLKGYDWSETDIAVVASDDSSYIPHHIHILTVGTQVRWGTQLAAGVPTTAGVYTGRSNTERELSVGKDCPEAYGTLAAELRGVLARGDDPPPVFSPASQLGNDYGVLVGTTSGRPVAMRLVRVHILWEEIDAQEESVVLAVPPVSNLVDWFRAFLTDIHAAKLAGVPQPPPALGNPSDWYTPDETRLADRIQTRTAKIGRLERERDRLEADLVSAGERADTGVRRVLWADGNELVAGVAGILSDLDFEVRDMDSERAPDTAKREDLRLTHDERPGWEAIAEVKGYTKGTKTNDARQIRDHRDRYIQETGRPPDLTLWVANPHRRVPDPSTRPAPDGSVNEAAAIIGAVHVLVPDLYRQWALVAHGTVEASDVAQQLIDASPGCWNPQVV